MGAAGRSPGGWWEAERGLPHDELAQEVIGNLECFPLADRLQSD